QGAELLDVTPEEPFMGLKLGRDELHTQLVGAYNASNALAALAVGDYFGVSRADAIAAVEAYCPSNQRSQMMRTERNTLIVDAYNANPSSMKAALDNFASVKAADKLALLGDMRELGEESVAEHVKVLHQLESSGIKACLVGEEFSKALKEIGLSCFNSFSTSEELATSLKAHPVSGCTILVKGSRGIQMEKVLSAL
ncbi:MAG: UDP-N-acetylmuramoyl-tripeptide--D-alanyl-D-alanine ligase, partial [Bacteroidales bacterium]|nr:UDP-N-acetylmuramoyl-tripeptide--D-alanyl-D-alanine ligase [Bacteroidales bacterium]